MSDCRTAGLLLVAMLGYALALPTCARRAHAQTDEALDLARLCVHEAGWDSPDDCAAIFAVVRNRRARVRSFGRHLLAGTTRHAPWVLELTRAATAPPHMHDASWTRDRGTHPSRRAAWLALLDACDRIVQEPPACDARTWGNASDFRRAAAHGRSFRFSDCGTTRNLFAVELAR